MKFTPPKNITKQDLVEIFDYHMNEDYLEYPAHQYYRTIALFHKDNVRYPDVNGFGGVLFLGDYILTYTDQVPVKQNMRNALVFFKMDYAFECYYRNHKIRDKKAFKKYMDWWNSDRTGFKWAPSEKKPANIFKFHKYDRGLEYLM
jgi:hypothetical protein